VREEGHAPVFEFVVLPLPSPSSSPSSLPNGFPTILDTIWIKISDDWLLRPIFKPLLRLPMLLSMAS